ncbi:hypothetical protein [Streptomyces sp. NPDC101115]|uniref:hypothetical protein n=1 Tax=Streptomyces sp. NPDC101115 TaxID=3366106 RepID=UPI003808D2EC
MPERTQLISQNEPPAAPDVAVRAGLRWMAERLRTVRPYGHVTPSTRDALARRYAYDQHGYNDDADQLYDQLLALMPHVPDDVAREDYAETLARAAGDDQ